MSLEKYDKRVRWWESDKSELHKDLHMHVSQLDMEQGSRRDRNLESMRLYGNINLAGLSPYNYNTHETPMLPTNRVKINIVSSMCDTVTSKIGKMKPRVTFLTSGGDFSAQRKAKNLTGFMTGLFYRCSTHKLHQEMFRDATIFDIGAVKHYICSQSNDIVSERVLATELYVDTADAVYGKPRTLYQVKYVSKELLKKQYKKNSEFIDSSTGSFNASGIAHAKSDSFVVVIEAWHLPSSKGAKDGRHTICTDQTVLFDEKYEKDYFPFTFFRWAELPVGFYGQSLAQRLTGNQIEINKMLRTIQKSFHLGSAFKVFLEQGSKVVREHINNEVGSIVYYRGAPPQYYVPQTVHPEYFRHLEFLIRQSYEEAGVSQLAASSRKPSGIESGKALREYNDINTERFAVVSQAYEATFLHTAKIYLDLVKDMAAKGNDLQVVAESKKFMRKIKWSEVQMDDNEFVMQMFPTSMLPHEPVGRLAYVQELIQGGFVSPEWGSRLLDIPDTEAYANIANAPIDIILMSAESILEGREYIPPEPNDNLALAKDIFTKIYAKARLDNAPEDVLEKLRRWIQQADNLMNRAASAATQMGAGGMPAEPNMMTGNMPMTPEQTQQLPNNVQL
jgi:hypothetical protein